MPRKYIYIDEEMIVKAQVFHNAIENAYLAQFSARFPFIDNAFLASFQTEINVAEALPLDGQVKADKNVDAEDANIILAQCKTALRALNRYAQLAFHGDKARKKAFGQDTWTKAFQNKDVMQTALKKAHEIAIKPEYQIPLFATGFTPDMVAELLTLWQQLVALHVRHQEAKKLRKVSTQDRIETYNAVWARMKTISICAKVVFIDNPAAKKLFMLYGKGKG